ncbi:MAG: tRNA uridine-5-carboxymethylaminomethyl(34) synthesis GTPase MnmE [Legionella sp.]|jgi:tRNA modification GTPase|nr:tRNA uridine-5-carboxymethylaminomethyl(34) synthesis GTPase MnmE [Legionella sp.]
MATDTIVAIATPPGRGGVGILRLSGALASAIAKRLTRREDLIVPKHVYYRAFYPEDATDQAWIDTGLLLYFQTPHSFTGEDVVEFQTHGSPRVLDRLLSACVACGARLARPGEFSERAFLNNKIDLAQAEAIADLIHANSETAARLAVRSLQGDFSKKINAINEQLVNLRLYVEAAIDFSDEEIDFLSDGKVAALFNQVFTDLLTVRTGASQGALLRESSVVVISGPPNAGKSTLLNALSGQDLAIVTDEAGTTRDLMREDILIDDIPLQLIDTAGLRESDHRVEQEGIKRAWQAIKRADVVLMMFDVADEAAGMLLDTAIQEALPEHVPVIKIFNKIDKTSSITPYQKDSSIYLSAKQGDGLDLLKSAIKNALGHQPAEGLFLARRRHLDALNQAHQCLISGQKQLFEHQAGELLAEDLRQAHDALCEITGEFTTDDLLGKIFSTFCIGK